MTLSSEEKRRILEAIEKDREFRHALMGLLGFREVLERITRLEERQQRLEERFARLEERQQKLEERQQRLEEKFAELEERFARIEERFAKLEERFARIEEKFAELEKRQQRLEEKFARLEERQQRLEEEMRETRRVLIVIAHRFGVLSETGFREAMKYVVEEALGAGVVEKKSLVDEEGFVYGHKAIVDIDVLVRDKEHVIIEVKSRVSRSDVAELYRIGRLYEKTYGVKPRLVVIGGFIDENARATASKLGVEIKPVFKDGQPLAYTL